MLRISSLIQENLNPVAALCIISGVVLAHCCAESFSMTPHH
ncbi:hypothetical protein SFyv_3600 [Shigella flexneri Shi06HN006]|nr:hypothetical protein SFyv_3600 [Shigella flexneri Shi06HN006]EFS15284.1 hypothetical protein SF2457T_0510 [Shigella flexneri 2a str. 2457T]